MMNKLFNVAIATSLLVSGNAFSTQGKKFVVQASITDNARINVQMLSQNPNIGKKNSLYSKIVKTIFDIKGNTLTFRPRADVFRTIKEHYLKTGGRFSFFGKYWKRAWYDNLIALVSELASQDIKVIQGLLSEEVKPIDLTNPSDDQNIAEFVTWYAILLDLVESINKAFNIRINLQDIPRASRATRWTQEAAYLLAPAAMLATTAFIDDLTPDNRYIVGPSYKGIRIGNTAGLWGAMGATLGLAGAWYRNLGRRTTFAQRAKSMGWGASKGFALGATVGAGKQILVEAKLLKDFNKWFDKKSYSDTKTKMFIGVSQDLKENPPDQAKEVNPTSSRHAEHVAIKILNDNILPQPQSLDDLEQYLYKLKFIYNDIFDDLYKVKDLDRKARIVILGALKNELYSKVH
jgi:hypothetical protein